MWAQRLTLRKIEKLYDEGDDDWASKECTANKLATKSAPEIPSVSVFKKQVYHQFYVPQDNCKALNPFPVVYIFSNIAGVWHWQSGRACGPQVILVTLWFWLFLSSFRKQ